MPGAPATHMPRPGPFADFRPSWILHEDPAVLVIHKPAGLPSQAADPDQADDVLTRLRAFLHRRDGGELPYLGVHQRLDRDASGVMLLARSRAANPALARQFEGRQVDKRYLVGVTGSPPGHGERTLVDHLARGKDGRSVVVGRSDKRGKKAVSHLRCLRRKGTRALLEVRIETGRTHQIRAQLAHAGWPVAGDRLYGGAPAPRLLLHARSLALAHPMSGDPLELDAPPPPIFERWLGRGGTWLPPQPESLRAAIERAAHRRWGLAQRRDAAEAIDAFRLVHSDGDGLPGLHVDVYGDHLVAHLASDEAVRQRDLILATLSELGFAGIYEKIHPRQKNELARTGHADLSPAHASWGQDAPQEQVIHEWGIPYPVWLADGLRTGIFLDQRDNRRRIRELADGRSLLNLFSYNGAFTIAAAVGGARRTVSVDASKRALIRGKQGLAQAGCEGDHRIVHGDAFDYLRRCKERFDLVVVDPPTYSKTKRGRWTSGKDWQRLAAMSFKVAEDGGTLLLCSNDERMSGNQFRRFLHEGARQAEVRIQQMKDLQIPADFPAPVGGEAHLKAVLVAL